MRENARISHTRQGNFLVSLFFIDIQNVLLYFT